MSEEKLSILDGIQGQEPSEVLAAAEKESAPETPDDVDYLVLVKEKDEPKAYKLKDSKIEFDTKINDDGTLTITGGKLITNYLIQNSEIDQLETWRYIISGVKLKSFHVDTAMDTITYSFSAEQFMDNTLLDMQGES